MTDEQKLLGCPFCQQPLTVRSGVNAYGACRTDGCYGGKIPVVSLDDPAMVTAWNNRAPNREQIRFTLVQSGWPVKLPSIKDFSAYWGERRWPMERIANRNGYLEFKNPAVQNLWMGWRAALASIPQPPFTDLDAAVEVIAMGWEQRGGK